MQVVSAAIIMTKAGKRTALVTALRINDTAALEQIRTSAVAMAKPKALTVELLVPSNGHKPSSCTKPGLFFHKPLILISRNDTLMADSPRYLSGQIAGHGFGQNTARLYALRLLRRVG